jgi:STE24 endopeptidase
MQVNEMFELPWKPLYTQSGGAASSGGDEETGETSPLALWIMAGTVAFTILVYSLEGSLDARQKAAYQKTKFPEELSLTVAKIDAERASKKSDGNNADDDSKPLLEQLQAKFKSSQTYGLDKINFGMFSSTYDVLESVAFLFLGFSPYMWDKSVFLGESWFGFSADDEIKISLIFLLLVTIVGTITSLPFELYSTFQIEKKHGFNKQTYGLFFGDKVKSLLLTLAIGGPFVALLLKIIKVSTIINATFYNHHDNNRFLPQPKLPRF